MLKKLFLFFIFGIMVLGLVSGATYTLDTGSSSSSSSSSSSGGGGGGGGGASGGLTFIITNEQFSSGYSKDLSVGDKLKFDVENETHQVELNELTNTTMKIVVSSDSQEAVLSIGDTRRFDLTGDNYYDLSVKLNNINATSAKASVTIKSINVEITAETIAEEQGKQNSADEEHEGGELISEKGFNWKLWGGIILVIVVIGLVIYALKKQKFINSIKPYSWRKK